MVSRNEQPNRDHLIKLLSFRWTLAKFHKSYYDSWHIRDSLGLNQQHKKSLEVKLELKRLRNIPF